VRIESHDPDQFCSDFYTKPDWREGGQCMPCGNNVEAWADNGCGDAGVTA